MYLLLLNVESSTFAPLIMGQEFYGMGTFIGWKVGPDYMALTF